MGGAYFKRVPSRELKNQEEPEPREESEEDSKILEVEKSLGEKEMPPERGGHSWELGSIKEVSGALETGVGDEEKQDQIL